MSFSLDGSQVGFITAYLAGLLTFFASCILPLVPTYLGYLSGIAFRDLDKKENSLKIFKTASIFVFGFVLSFVLMGLLLQRLAGLLIVYRPMIEKVSGVFFIVFGLYLLGIFKSRFLAKEKQTNLNNFFEKNIYLHALFTGLGFGFSWTPCIGPVLAVILYWSAQAETTIIGSLLLVSFGFGIGTPFLLVSLAFEKLVPLLKRYKHISKYITYISGAIVLLFGLLLFLGQYQTLAIGLVNFLSISAKSF
ncbi:MAG: cytochrome c biogenesis CcdA family protein [Patescibacteria group bacterium]